MNHFISDERYPNFKRAAMNSNKMKAIVNRKFGTPDVFELQDVEMPTPKANEVLVKVRAASINSWDWDYLRGKPYLYRLLFGFLKPKHNILGADIAGIVEAVGKNVNRLQPGDEVYGDLSGCDWGGFAEYTCARENVLAKKPPGLTFEEAAAVPQAGVLALQGLRYNGEIQHGQKILINGAGGGVGTFGVQIAKLSGAEVTVVDRTEKLGMLRSLGADHVVDYTKEDFTKNGQKYDLIIDVVAHKSISDYTHALNPNGVFVVIGGSIALMLKVVFLGSWIARSERKKLGILAHKVSIRDLDYLSELFEAGKVKPIVDKCYPLSEVAEAFRYFGKGHFKGKVVISI